MIILLLLIAAILFGMATFSRFGDRFDLVAGGLFCIALSMLIPLLGPLL